MKISYNWLKEYVPKLPKPETVEELLTMHAFEVEGMEKTRGDIVFDVAVLPNRAHDCLSHQGIAWEIAAIAKLKFRFSKKARRSEQKNLNIRNYLKVEVKDREKCPRYTSRVVVDVKVGPSPAWLRTRLEALGQKSINNMVDAVNWVMLALGQPMHVFDLDKIDGGRIIVRRAKKGEAVATLDGNKMALGPEDLVIADAKGLLAIAGIKGGKKAEVTSQTKNIALESAYFDPASVRATSKRIGLRTEASWRFEHGVIPFLAPLALEECAGMIAKLAGGKVVSGVCDTGAKISAPVHIAVWSAEGVRKLLGAEIPEKEMCALLARLGFKTKKRTGGCISRVPWWRLDVESEADIAEEIGRLWGYMNIVPKLPDSTLIPPSENNREILFTNIRVILAHIGFSETYNRSFIGRRHAGLVRGAGAGFVSVANPLSEDQNYLRPSLLFGLLDNVVLNLKHQRSTRLFELGEVFRMEHKKTVGERAVLSGIIAEKKGEGSPRAEIFYEAKGFTDALLEKLGVDEVWYDDFHSPAEDEESRFWHKGRTAEIKAGDRRVGTVGEIHPELLLALGIEKQRVVAFEIEVAALLDLVEEKRAYRPISRYPAVERDVAVAVPFEVKIDTVQEVIERAGGELLEDSDLFDVYEGEHLEAEEKSLAFHLIFQSFSRTLTDGEVNVLVHTIIRALEAEGWEVRK